MKKFRNYYERIPLRFLSKETIRVMKLTVFLSLFTISQLFATETYSQLTKLSLKLEDVRISEVLREIENESEFFFLYSPKLVDVERRVTINTDKETIKDILGNIFDEKVKFIVYDKQIILTPNDANSYPLSLQQRKIDGKVTDETGNPLPGVNVTIEGTTIGTITDIDGKYSIDNPGKNAVLLFSFIGYTNQKISVAGKTTIDISLVPSTTSLNEVLVVGYGTVLKKNITTSVSKVTMEEIPKASSSNVTQLLMGRAAGLQATVASAQPGGNVRMSIRGAGTPIYVVDGVIMPSTSLEPTAGNAVTMLPNNVNRSNLAGVNPDDIESVEILKDASASIYGIGASQGVILITTKKAKEGPLRISYDGSYSVVNNYKYYEPLNAQQYMGLINVFNKERYLFQNNLAPYGDTPYTSGWNPIFSDDEIASAQTTDWLSKVLRSGAISNHNLTLDGGTKGITYYVSGNYFSQDGTVHHSNMERYSLRSNLSAQLTSFMKLTSIINVNRNHYNNSTIGGSSTVGAQGAGALINALKFPPNIPVYDANGKYSEFRNVPNPVGEQNITDFTNTNGVYLNFAADFTIIKNMLTAKVLFGDNSEESRRSTYIPSNIYFDQMYKSRGNLSSGGRENQTLEATMTFNKEFGSFIKFDAVIGVGKYNNKTTGMNVAYNIQNDAIANDNLATITGVITPGSYTTADEKRSQFVRLNFDILDRYVIAGTFRRDGTDKFFPGKKYALFPSVSAAWKISNESFMKGIVWINLLKLRGSYGTTGSDNLGSTLYGTFSPSGTYVPFNQNAIKYIPIIIMGRDYPDVTWEKTTMKNIGLDFSILKDRISGSFDLFRNDITNMLGYDNTAGLSMFGTYPINGGHLRREGWDASINMRTIEKQNFIWTSAITLSRFNAIWIERFPNYSYNTFEKRSNAPYYARYFYEANGIIDASLSNVPESQPLAAQKPGYPIIVDRNKDGSITIEDIKMTNEVPKIYFGFGNTFTYRNFDLDIFIYSQLGTNKYNYGFYPISATGLADIGNNQYTYANRLWNSQTNPEGTLPGVAYGLSSVSLPGGAGISLNYQDASFVRVRNITLGYNFPSKMLGGASKYISSIRLYGDAQNPLLFTKFEGEDPEVDSGVGLGVNESVPGSGVGTQASLPMTRTFTIGINVIF